MYSRHDFGHRISKWKASEQPAHSVLSSPAPPRRRRTVAAAEKPQSPGASAAALAYHPITKITWRGTPLGDDDGDGDAAPARRPRMCEPTWRRDPTDGGSPAGGGSGGGAAKGGSGAIRTAREELELQKASDMYCFSHACPVGVCGVGHISACRGFDPPSPVMFTVGSR